MPFLLTTTLRRAVPIALFSLLDFFFIIGSYGVLRVLHIPVNWVTWVIGTILLVASGISSLLIFVPSQSAAFSGDALIGIVSFGIAIYSAAQWITRRWYLVVKKWAVPLLVVPSRNAFLFMRTHHQFFGWIVFATASAHALSYIFILNRISQLELITGLIVWALLALLTGAGMWIEDSIKSKHMSKNARLFHIIIAIAFFIAFLTHA